LAKDMEAQTTTLEEVVLYHLSQSRAIMR